MKKQYVWMVTSDGAEYGEYANNASASLFKTHDEAQDFVQTSLEETVINRHFDGKRPAQDKLDEKMNAYCVWYGDDTVQYRDDIVVNDYAITKVPVPTK